MKNRVECKARELLSGGNALSKYDLEAQAPCHHRTAQRVLSALYKNGVTRIVGWQKIYRHVTPIYKIGKGKDAAKPDPLTTAERNRRRRRNPEVRWEESVKKKQLRFRSKHVPVQSQSNQCG